MRLRSHVYMYVSYTSTVGEFRTYPLGFTHDRSCGSRSPPMYTYTSYSSGILSVMIFLRVLGSSHAIGPMMATFSRTPQRGGAATHPTPSAVQRDIMTGRPPCLLPNAGRSSPPNELVATTSSLGARVSDIQGRRSSGLSRAALATAMRQVELEDADAPYWAQGDQALYSEKNLKRRHKLRDHPAVLEVLDVWWDCCRGKDNTVGRSLYVNFCKKVYKAMIEVWEEDEAQETAEEDWDNDSKGASALSREAYLDAIFELADVRVPAAPPCLFAPANLVTC